MRFKSALLVIMLAGAVALVGCGKSSSSKQTAPVPGVVDLNSLVEAFPTPSPEVAQSLVRLRFAVRYRQPQTGLVELDKMSRIPGLTEPQKKAINDAIEQFKQAASNTAPPPNQ